jgi:hypothetical protein
MPEEHGCGQAHPRPTGDHQSGGELSDKDAIFSGTVSSRLPNHGVSKKIFFFRFTRKFPTSLPVEGEILFELVSLKK